VVRSGLAAADVGCLETLRSLEQVELNRFAFVQRAIAVFLDCGEVNENVFACGALNEPVSLGSVKPLYCTLLSHKVLLSPLVIEFAAILREACASIAPLEEFERTCLRSFVLTAVCPQKGKALNFSENDYPRVQSRTTICEFDDVAQHINLNRKKTITHRIKTLQCARHIIEELTLMAREIYKSLTNGYPG